MNNKYDNLINFMIERRKKNEIIDANTHIATFVQYNKNINLNKIKIGENSNRIRYNNIKIKTHAEINALEKMDLKSNNSLKNKNINVDLIVLRINKQYSLCDSAPCYHCTCELKKKHFINIKNIYFSTSEGLIKCVNFNDWNNQTNHHISKGWKNINKP